MYNCVNAEEVGAAVVFRRRQVIDDRATPYTVPSKAVPPECGALGRIRPAHSAPAGANGFSPPVPVRVLLHAGGAVQPLRPGQPLLQPHLQPAGPRCRTV